VVVVRIKICGITNSSDALLAASLGADALGFVFWKKSPRYITPDAAAAIIKKLPPFMSTVGVFVDEDSTRVNEIVKTAGLNFAQLHGSESPEYCVQIEGNFIKAIRVKDAGSLQGLDEYGASAILLDTFIKGQPGGTGKTFDMSLLVGMDFKGKVMLAGGLTPDNVEEALNNYSPYAVDASSGLELEPGKKDPAKLRAFIEKVRSFKGNGQEKKQ
jgi:phosphoribosylanthranilate isomerase